MVKVGTVLYAYHEGFFGSSCWEDLRVEAVGADWVVARGINDGIARMATFEKGWQLDEMEVMLDKWSRMK
jgi:hypothetical protein